MKVKMITTTAILIGSLTAFQVSQNHLQSKPDGAPTGVTGSPGDNNNTCAKSGCHTGVAVKTKTGLIKSNVPATGYVPGAIYTITAKVKSATVNRWGFEISPQNPTTYAKLGTLIVTNSTQTKLVGTGKYITHKQAGNSGAGTKTWTFNWQAPPAGSGKVKFYGAFLYANNNGSESGDTTYKSTLVIYEDTIPAPRLTWENNAVNTTVCAASLEATVYPNPFRDASRIRINSMSDEDISYTIYDVSGSLVQKSGAMPVDSCLEFGNDLVPGIYFVRLTQGENSRTMKIIKTR